jgi:hypothetical protein
MHEPLVETGKASYLARVLVGLAMLALWVAAAILLPTTPISSPGRQIAVGALALGMFAILPLAQWLAGRADELQHAIHQQACTRSMPWLAASCGAAGVLQANGLLPVLNQLWMLGFLVAVWGLQLMLADRPYH